MFPENVFSLSELFSGQYFSPSKIHFPVCHVSLSKSIIRTTLPFQTLQIKLRMTKTELNKMIGQEAIPSLFLTIITTWILIIDCTPT